MPFLPRLLQHHVGLSGAQLLRVQNCFTVQTIKRHTLLLSAGATCNHLYLIGTGCVRTYYLTQQGQEKTRYLGFDGSVVTSLSSFITQDPASEFLETLEESELFAISRNDFYQLVEEVPAWEKFYRSLLEMAYTYQHQKITQLVTLSAKQRYHHLLAQHPAYTQRLSNKILASYLDVAQETLSRLKSR